MMTGRALPLATRDKAAAEELIRKADVVCPYSDALRGNVDVELNMV